MSSVELKNGRTFVIRVAHNSELVRSITDFVKEKEIEKGFFTAIGALKNAKLAYYEQQKHEYTTLALENPHEIASCIGNVSLREGEPFLHAHIVLADKDGSTRAGHLLEGTVFAAEVHLQELIGPKLVREPDEITGLSLWKI